jgi:hypothetical protein
MTDPEAPSPLDQPLEPEPEVDPYADKLPQAPRDPRPEPGDPPAAVRGPSQVVKDPSGDAADDGSRRWDPRTSVTDQQEGG